MVETATAATMIKQRIRANVFFIVFSPLEI
jgi:hypothetical protein